MCILIDTCTISKVFNRSNSEHYSFEPVKNYILFGIGKMIYGGSKYKRELFAVKGISGLIIELKKSGKAIELSEKDVDKYEYSIINNHYHPLFNDAHLVAIIITSGCKLLCTCDKDAFPFLLNKDIYPRRGLVPKLYTNRKQLALLRNPKNIVDICKPSFKLSKKQLNNLGISDAI